MLDPISVTATPGNPQRVRDVQATVEVLGPDQVNAVVTAYDDSKLQSLRGALAIVFIVGVLGLLVTGGLPKEPLGARGPPEA